MFENRTHQQQSNRATSFVKSSSFVDLKIQNVEDCMKRIAILIRISSASRHSGQDDDNYNSILVREEIVESIRFLCEAYSLYSTTCTQFLYEPENPVRHHPAGWGTMRQGSFKPPPCKSIELFPPLDMSNRRS